MILWEINFVLLLHFVCGSPSSWRSALNPYRKRNNLSFPRKSERGKNIFKRSDERLHLLISSKLYRLREKFLPFFFVDLSALFLFFHSLSEIYHCLLFQTQYEFYPHTHTHKYIYLKMYRLNLLFCCYPTLVVYTTYSTCCPLCINLLIQRRLINDTILSSQVPTYFQNFSSVCGKFIFFTYFTSFRSSLQWN